MDNIHLIKTEEEYDKIMERVLELAESDFVPGSEEHEELNILSLLIKDYDDKHYPTPPSDPIEAIKFEMDQKGLRPVDMKKIFGTTSRFYEIINGKRKLSINMIKKLHKELGISYDCLMA